ncbi:MAG TPA: vitamin K epoxide reductase family protein [Candidatus Paceibacterota bacterium]|nr:vitamin K epoxide reductase family protein [Candidatus Paceibacterota bacterium]
MKTRKWVWAILILSFFGVADATYLAQHALSNTPLLCNVENLSGCNIVASSQYSRLFGIPLAVYGVAFYGILFVLSALELVIFDRLLRRILQGVAALGFLSSLYFVSVQIFLIGAFCIYCFASATISLAILGSATAIEPLRGADGSHPFARLKRYLSRPAAPKAPSNPPMPRPEPPRPDQFRIPPRP